MKSRILYIILGILVLLPSCMESEWDIEMDPQGTFGDNPGNRLESIDKRKVMLLYSAGYNDLQTYLKEDIEDLLKGWAPGLSRNNDVLLVYSHLSKSRSDFKTPVEPVLFRVYADNEGNTLTDTLIRYDSSTISASAEQLNAVLTYVNETFPARSYGMVFSSHATGYLPAGYYSRPGEYVFTEDRANSHGTFLQHEPTSVPYIEREYGPDRPMVKSIGQSVHEGQSYEMDLRDFAEAIPMKLDYILFDACLMGGIEVAYELTRKCDLLAFSQAEVLAEGLNYTTLAEHLLGNRQDADPESVCRDYFMQYDQKTGAYRSATISLVDCNRLGPLADVCQDLFSRYRQQIGSINYNKVQQFYTGNHHWFYDLESILSVAGISAEELGALHDALDGCIIYKGHTPSFLGEFDINTFSGFSMYLPTRGSQQLDRYYRTLKWNEATGLVQ